MMAEEAGLDNFEHAILRLEDEEKWLRLLGARNLTSHTYDQETAIEVYETVKDNFEVFQGLLEELREEI
jgi:nucleotidyltransferase substrate binding protein (TIGR01987 family)